MSDCFFVCLVVWFLVCFLFICKANPHVASVESLCKAIDRMGREYQRNNLHYFYSASNRWAIYQCDLFVFSSARLLFVVVVVVVGNSLQLYGLDQRCRDVCRTSGGRGLRVKWIGLWCADCKGGFGRIKVRDRVDFTRIWTMCFCMCSVGDVAENWVQSVTKIQLISTQSTHRCDDDPETEKRQIKLARHVVKGSDRCPQIKSFVLCDRAKMVCQILYED